ncbi:MAG: ATP-binding protein [Prolixibacteraceae bacterium]
MRVLNSLRARLIIPVISISLTLLIVTIVFLGYRQLQDIRNNVINQTRANLQLIADYASVPLIFDQPEDAREVLSELKNIRPVLSAAIYGEDNSLFVSYTADSVRQQGPSNAEKESIFGDKKMVIAVPIIHRTIRYGSLVAEVDLNVQEGLIREMLWLFLMVFGIMAILAVILAFVFERKFLEPILTLTRKFGEISITESFTRIAPSPFPATGKSSDEIEILIAGYNKMVAALTLREKKQVEAEAALKQMNEKLESNVAERTRELKQAHEKLQKLYENEKGILENLPYGIILIDYERKVVAVNDFAKNLLCFTEKLPVHSSEFSLFCRTHNGPNCIEELIKSSRQSVFLNSKGEELPVLRTIVPISYNDQDVIMIAFVDIADLQKIQKELIIAKEKAEESDRLKSAFLANMSHEIRTPLNAIVGFTNMLITEEFDQATKETYFQIVDENTESLLNLIEDILDLSKLESGTLDINPKETDVYAFSRDIHKNALMIRNRMNKESIEIRLNLNGLNEGVTCFFDNFRIKQVLLNLVNNALKFTDEGLITLTVEKKEKEFQFSVRDTGSGIEDKDREHVFDRFYKSSDKKRLYKGTGLGLAICKSLVELSGGRIWLETKAGTGTTFHFTLPAAR